eukprot:scaffold17968_cov66-Phaeocystis_antarctica.AAC.5
MPHLVAALPLLLLVCVAGGRRVEGVDAAVEVDVVDELVEVAVPGSGSGSGSGSDSGSDPVVGVLELEVCATRPHLVRRQRVVVLLDRVLHELVHPLVGVVVVEARVVVDLRHAGLQPGYTGCSSDGTRLQAATHLLGRAVEVHPGRVAAVTRAVEVACEDLRRAAERLRAWHAHPLEARVALLLGAAHVAVLPVHPPPVEGLEPRLCPKQPRLVRQPRLRVRVAEGVDLPRRARRRVGAEVLKDELVAARRLVDHRRPGDVCIYAIRAAAGEATCAQAQKRACVRRAHHSGEASSCMHQPPLRGGERALGVARLLPPAREEGRLDVDEPSVRIGRQVLHDRVDREVDLLLEVLVDGHLPAGVVVAVRHEVHVDLALDGTAARVVLAVLGEGVRRRAARLDGLVPVELNGRERRWRTRTAPAGKAAGGSGTLLLARYGAARSGGSGTDGVPAHRQRAETQTSHQ